MSPSTGNQDREFHHKILDNWCSVTWSWTPVNIVHSEQTQQNDNLLLPPAHPILQALIPTTISFFFFLFSLSFDGEMPRAIKLTVAPVGHYRSLDREHYCSANILALGVPWDTLLKDSAATFDFLIFILLSGRVAKI